MHGYNGPPIGSRPPQVEWSRDVNDDVMWPQKVKSVTPLSLKHHISVNGAR